jgi:hypothetical protein
LNIYDIEQENKVKIQLKEKLSDKNNRIMNKQTEIIKTEADILETEKSSLHS